MHDGFTLWADREPAPTCPMMSNYVRTLYELLLPPNTSGAFDRELLEKVVTMLRPKPCKAVNEYKLYTTHRKEDLKTARIHLLACMVLDRLRSTVSCWLLQFLVSLEGSVRALVEQTFNETTFYSSAKTPSLGNNPSSLSRYVAHLPRLCGSPVDRPFHFSISSFNT